MNISSLNKIISSSELDVLIKQNYTIELFNVTDLDQADFICTGEAHDSDSHRRNQARIVDHFYQEGRDKVLLELPAFTLVPQRFGRQIGYSHKVKQPYGWDFRRTDYRIYSDLSSQDRRFKIALITLIAVSLLFFWSPESLFENSFVEPFLIVVALTGIFVGASAIRARNKTMKVIESEMLARNLSMISEMGKHHAVTLPLQGKVFVIGGAEHFPGGSSSGQLEFASRCIRDYFRDKRAAILIPKEDNWIFSRNEGT